MYDRQRTGAPALIPAALTLIPMAACAIWVASAFAQSRPHARASAAADRHATAPNAGGTVVATVNGTRITQEEIANDVLAAQMTKLTATNPMLQDRARVTAGSVGALVLNKMREHPGQPVTVTHAEIVNWLFKDKPQSLYQTVQTKIAQVAINQEAGKEGITVTPAEIAQQMAKTISVARKNIPGASGTDADLLRQIGVSSEFLRPMVRTQYALEKMVRHDFEKSLGHPVGDSDYISASHVLVMVQPNPGSPGDTEKKFAEAKAKIDAIAADIAAGKTTFEKAASANNTDSTKFKGGDLGVIVRGQPGWDKDFMKAAFETPVGKVSAPIRSQFGWHLIRVDKSGKDLSAEDKQKALNTLMQQRINARAQEIIARAKVTNTLQQPAQRGVMPMGMRAQ